MIKTQLTYSLTMSMHGCAGNSGPIWSFSERGGLEEASDDPPIFADTPDGFLAGGTVSSGASRRVGRGRGSISRASRRQRGFTGATVYDGDHFFTEEGGALRLRCKGALLELAEKSAALVRHAGDGTPGLGAEAELVEGTLVFSTARTGELEIQTRETHIRSAGAGRTVAQVSVIGPKELHIYARHGAVLFSYRGESKTITEGESYEVILDPPEDGSEKKQPAPNRGLPPKAFLLVAGGVGAAAAGVILYEKRQHKDVESPDRP